MFKTLFSKMLSTYLAVMLSVMILLGVTMANLFADHYISQNELKLRSECAEIDSVITNKYLDADKRNAAIEELSTIARKYDGLIQIQFKDPQYGKASISNEASDKWAKIADYYLAPDGLGGMPRTPGDTVLNDAYATITSMPTMTLAKDIIYRNANVGVLFFTVDMSETNHMIRGVIIDVIIYSILGIVLALLAVLYITDRISKPITRMTRVVRRFTQGNYDDRVQYKAEDEVGELAKSFNQMADEINTLEAARRSFVANVSHELRSPLTSMRGFLVAMQDGTIPTDDHEKYLSIVIDENNRMISMVNDLLDIARIESGENVLHCEVFEIAEVIRRTLITFEARISEKRINVEINFEDEQIYVEADKQQIIQVLRNLLDNAIRFTPENGKITLSLATRRKQAWVAIRDSGPGISEEDIPYVFDRFYKAEKAHTPSASAGTGLGLAIVKRIMDAHSQEITVKSDDGACFMFSLKRVNKPFIRGVSTR